MLDTLNKGSPASFPPVRSPQDSDAASEQQLVSAVVSLLYRQWSLIAAVTAVSFAAGITYLLLASPTYTAAVTLEIEGRKTILELQAANDRPGVAAGDGQIEILRSEAVARRVIELLQLTSNPEFSSGYSYLDPSFWGTRALAWVRGNETSLDSTPDAAITSRVIRDFRQRLSVKRLGTPNPIEVSFSARNPEIAAKVANAMVDAYSEYQLETARASAASVDEWLRRRLPALRGQVAAAEQAVVDFKSANGLVETGAQLVAGQQLSETNTRLAQARDRRQEAEAKLKRLRELISGGHSESLISDGVSSEVSARLRQQLVAAITREREMTARYGLQHGATQTAKAEVASIRRAMLDELSRMADTAESDLAIAKERERLAQGNVAAGMSASRSASEALIALRELESTAKTHRDIYNRLAQQQAESLQNQSLPLFSARVVSPASVPVNKSHPRDLFVLAASLLGGFGSGLALAIGRQLVDRVVRTANQVETIWGVECLALLPKLAVPTSSTLTYVADQPFSRFTEGVRSVKLAVDVATGSHTSGVLGLSSALPNEGKSTVASNLAHLIALAGRRTILVDLDLRNPSLSRSLAPAAADGLIEVITRKRSLGEVLINRSSLLDFLPAPQQERLAHTSELVDSEGMRGLIDELRDLYDCVVLDLPPFAPIVDSRIALNHVDQLIFVVEWGRTRIDVVSHALTRAKLSPEQLTGVVLNKVDLNALARIERFGGRYYSNSKYYSRYGYTD